MKKVNKGVTYDDVCEACTILITEGRSTTQANIREILGTGSFSTIAKHLNKWKEAQQSTSKVGDAPSDDRPAELNALSDQLWLKAKQDAETKADKRIALIEADAEGRIAKAQDGESEAVEMMNRSLSKLSMVEQLNKELQAQLTKQTEEYTRQLELLKHQNRLAGVKVEENNKQLEALKRDLEDAEHERNDTLSKLNALKEQYSTQLTELTKSSQANLSREQQRGIDIENRLLKQIDELRLSIKVLEDEKQALSQAVLEAREQSHADIKAVTTQFSEIASLIRENHQGNAELKKQARKLGEEVCSESKQMRRDIAALLDRLNSIEDILSSSAHPGA